MTANLEWNGWSLDSPFVVVSMGRLRLSEISAPRVWGRRHTWVRNPEIETPEGVRLKYPWRRFWELAGEYGVQAVVTSDAHRPVDVGANLAEGRTLAAECGLEVEGEAWVEERLVQRVI